jgi:hypothetical protein
VLGGAIATHGLNGFVVLFFVNAFTYLLCVVILVVGVREDARPIPIAGGYRVVLRDRPFVRLALINIAVIAVGGASSRGSSPRTPAGRSGSARA